MTVQLILPSAEQKARVNLGWQCPECSGVRVETFESVRFIGAFKSFQCQDCGCQWRSGYYPELPR